MSAPTRSAYPPGVEELLPQARKLARELGGMPSQNRLKSDLRIGADKARELKARLESEHDPEFERPRRLHPVPHPEPDTEPVSEPGAGAADPADDAAAGDQVPEGSGDQSGGESGVESGTTDPTPAAGSETETSEQVTVDAEPVTTMPQNAPARVSSVRSWPVLLLALPAFVAIWSGWVGLGGLTGFGMVRPLPGLADWVVLNTAITLPIGVETYAAYALRVWLSGRVPARARAFAKWSALGSLGLGALGQVAYHLMQAAGITVAPWWITTVVSCLPVAVLGMGAALAHLIHDGTEGEVA